MDKYITKLKNAAEHELLSGTFYIFVGTTVSSFLAFILNVYFARELSYADYGIYASLLSIFTLLIIPSAALTAIVVRYATLFFTKNEESRAGAFYVKSFKYLVLFGIVLNLIFILIYPYISDFLKIDQLGLILLAGISVAIFYLATLNLGFLQSLLKFKLLGFLFFLAGIGKLVTGVVLVFLGWKVYGALIATLAFALIDFIFSFFPLRKIISSAGKKVNISAKELTSYAVPTSVAIFSLSSFISTDVLLVKHFFSPTEAGFYGGLSLVGKVIFYFTGPIPVVMFPLIVKKHANNDNYRHLFYTALILVLVPSIFITGFYYIFPEFTLNLFLGGGGYLTMAPYLGLFGVFLTIYSVNNVFINYFVSIKKTKVALISLFWAVVQIVLIYIYHENFYEIILVSIISSLLLLCCLVLYYLKDYGNYKFRK